MRVATRTSASGSLGCLLFGVGGGTMLRVKRRLQDLVEPRSEAVLPCGLIERVVGTVMQRGQDTASVGGSVVWVTADHAFGVVPASGLGQQLLFERLGRRVVVLGAHSVSSV